jgi:hypothetical protein
MRGKLIVFASALFFLTLSVINAPLAQSTDPYAPGVGGVDTPVNFMMTLAVPVFAILGIFALLFVFGRSRVKTGMRQEQS